MNITTVIIETLDSDGFPIRIKKEYALIDNPTLLLTCVRDAALEFNEVRFKQREVA